MKNTQKGFIVPLLIAIIAVLAIGGGIYVFEQSKPQPITQQPVTNNQTVSTSTTQNSTSVANQTTGSKTYTNTKYGFTLNFPSSWSGYRTKEWKDNYYSVSFGIKDQDNVFSITAYNKAQWAEYQSGDLKPAQFIAQNSQYVFAWAHAQDYTNTVYPLTAQLNQIVSSFKLNVPTTQPSITVLSPNGGESFKQGDAMNIQWKTNIQGSHVVNIILQRTDETQTTNIAHNVLDNVSPVTGTSKYTWIIHSNLSGSFKVRVSSPDSQGQDNIDNKLSDTSNSSFTIINSSIAVSGMQQYTDSSFGFSFWYPSSWTVTQKQVTDPTDNGWFQNGTIVKTLSVTNPNNAVVGVTIQEFQSSGLAITELGQTKSASPVGVDQKYFFDPNAHTWMYENLTDAPNGNRPAGTITAADVSNNTMGGLHVLFGAKRFGADTIVPLNASHFLVISTNDVGGYTDQKYLVHTIVATDPSVATPVSVSQQTQTIQAESNAYVGQ